jgi:hypothetical protein
MLLPTMNKIRERARLAVCLSNLRQVTIGHLIYSNDNKGDLPFNTISANRHKGSHIGSIRRWDSQWNKWHYVNQIWGISPNHNSKTRNPPGKYLSDPGVFYCPAWVLHLRSGWYTYDATSLHYAPHNLHKAFMIEEAWPGYANFGSWQPGYNIFASGYTGADRKPPYDQYEVPYRIHAGFKRLSVSSPPRCWVVADFGQTPFLPHHVGEYTKGLTWPYNVVHMDGHADTHQIDPFRAGTSSTVRLPGMNWLAGGCVPYGNTGWDDSAWTGFGKQVTGLDMEEDKKGK